MKDYLFEVVHNVDVAANLALVVVLFYLWKHEEAWDEIKWVFYVSFALVILIPSTSALHSLFP